MLAGFRVKGLDSMVAEWKLFRLQKECDGIVWVPTASSGLSDPGT